MSSLSGIIITEGEDRGGDFDEEGRRVREALTASSSCRRKAKSRSDSRDCASMSSRRHSERREWRSSSSAAREVVVVVVLAIWTN